ncbi:MAG: hypothetical protein EBS08_01320 [Cytophagia bacterium]|nr:hypothetical protein [Cytophagia bacterium]
MSFWPFPLHVARVKTLQRLAPPLVLRVYRIQNLPTSLDWGSMAASSELAPIWATKSTQCLASVPNIPLYRWMPSLMLVASKCANPYVGLGFGRAAPKHRLGLGLDLGAYYIGPPKPEILATGMVKRTSEQSATLQENLKDFQWLPVFSFRLAVALF